MRHVGLQILGMKFWSSTPEQVHVSEQVQSFSKICLQPPEIQAGPLTKSKNVQKQLPRKNGAMLLLAIISSKHFRGYLARMMIVTTEVQDQIMPVLHNKDFPLGCEVLYPPGINTKNSSWQQKNSINRYK